MTCFFLAWFAYLACYFRFCCSFGIKFSSQYCWGFGIRGHQLMKRSRQLRITAPSLGKMRIILISVFWLEVNVTWRKKIKVFPCLIFAVLLSWLKKTRLWYVSKPFVHSSKRIIKRFSKKWTPLNLLSISDGHNPNFFLKFLFIFINPQSSPYG